MTMLTALQRLSPRLAGRLAFHVFARPGRRKPTRWTHPPDVLETVAAGTRPVRVARWLGGGSTVLLVHGWAGRAEDLDPFVGPLRDRGHRVVALDLPAHGGSPGRTTNLPELAAAVEAVARAEPDVHALVAHSLGATASILAALRGAPVRRLVALGAPVSMEPYLQRLERGLGLEAPARSVLRETVRGVLASHGWSTVELTDLVGALDRPALLVHDRADREVPFLAAQALARAWPGSTLHPTEGLGHRRLLADPDVVARVVDFAGTVAALPPPAASPVPRPLRSTGTDA